jgi:desulfoferrodoxin-like iron-binding protein
MRQMKRNLTGQVYRCPVCGAEVSVIRCGEGDLAPRCCNQAMALLPERHVTYFCPVCGSEIMVIRQGVGPLAPRCCNRPMVARGLAA